MPDGSPAKGDQQFIYDGISLRDYFAGQALAGEMANSEGGVFGQDVEQEHLIRAATLYYRIADAMLAARATA